MGAAGVAVIGGGPAGLMAAQVLVAQGLAVDLYDAMPSVGRKFLLAGRGGLNLTHSEAPEAFVARYGTQQAEVAAWLQGLDADGVRRWAHELGVETFVGSSGRVFPREMKAAPLLRAWLHRLRQAGVRFHMRHHWQGWDEQGRVCLQSPAGPVTIQPQALVLALGGGSWRRLGSDGAWVPWLAERGVPVAPLQPSNGGFDVPWGAHFSERFAGQPLKSIALGLPGQPRDAWRRGECLVTQTGLEGGMVYALSAPLREAIAAQGRATLLLDLLPDHAPERVRTEIARERGARSLATHLRSRLGLHGVKAGLLRECLGEAGMADPVTLAAAIKHLPVTLSATRPLDEAISSAGGVCFDGIDERGMLRALPGVFCAGEMLDWEAPTGGYLLTACLASGQAVGEGVRDWLA